MLPNYPLLNNPFWSALQTTQQYLAKGTENIKKFPATVLPFVGMANYDSRLLNEIAPFLQPGEEVFIKDAFTNIPADWNVLAKVPVIQMVCLKPPEAPVYTNEIVALAEEDHKELFALVDLVQPGYFKPQTHTLGKYYGIKKNGVLVAVAGERLKIEGFIEVSAVCTLPGHTGKGYAKQLVNLLCSEIFAAGNIPFLHVLETNERAIKLYEHLCFEKSMDFPLLKLKLD